MEKFGQKMLSGETVFLRKPEPEDLEYLYEVENNPEFWFASETKSPYSRWELKQHIENTVYDIFTNKELRLIICDKASEKQVGIVDLYEYHPQNNRCGVGIIVNKEYMNRGVASETLKLVKEYAFGVLLLNQLWCSIDDSNSVSIKLFENFGFHKTGTLKQWKRTALGYSDVSIYQCLK